MADKLLLPQYHMNDNNICILTTRPLANTAMLKAKDAGVRIDTASFIETNNIIDSSTAEIIKKYVAHEASVVFTSMNAAEAVIDCLEANSIMPDWC